METQDNNTQKTLNEGEALANLVASPGWNIAIKRLISRIIDVTDTQNVDTTKNATSIATDIKVNNRVAKELFAWVEDITGTADQHEQHMRMLKEERESVIMNF